MAINFLVDSICLVKIMHLDNDDLDRMKGYIRVGDCLIALWLGGQWSYFANI